MISQRVIFVEKRLDLLAQAVDTFDFFFQLANVRLFSLTESALSIESDGWSRRGSHIITVQVQVKHIPGQLDSEQHAWKWTIPACHRSSAYHPQANLAGVGSAFEGEQPSWRLRWRGQCCLDLEERRCWAAGVAEQELPGDGACAAAQQAAGHGELSKVVS